MFNMYAAQVVYHIYNVMMFGFVIEKCLILDLLLKQFKVL